MNPEELEKEIEECKSKSKIAYEEFLKRNADIFTDRFLVQIAKDSITDFFWEELRLKAKLEGFQAGELSSTERCLKMIEKLYIRDFETNEIDEDCDENNILLELTQKIKDTEGK